MANVFASSRFGGGGGAGGQYGAIPSQDVASQLVTTVKQVPPVLHRYRTRRGHLRGTGTTVVGNMSTGIRYRYSWA